MRGYFSKIPGLTRVRISASTKALVERATGVPWVEPQIMRFVDGVELHGKSKVDAWCEAHRCPKTASAYVNASRGWNSKQAIRYREHLERLGGAEEAKFRSGEYVPLWIPVRLLPRDLRTRARRVRDLTEAVHHLLAAERHENDGNLA